MSPRNSGGRHRGCSIPSPRRAKVTQEGPHVLDRNVDDLEPSNATLRSAPLTFPTRRELLYLRIFTVCDEDECRGTGRDSLKSLRTSAAKEVPVHE